MSIVLLGQFLLARRLDPVRYKVELSEETETLLEAQAEAFDQRLDAMVGYMGQQFEALGVSVSALHTTLAFTQGGGATLPAARRGGEGGDHRGGGHRA